MRCAFGASDNRAADGRSPTLPLACPSMAAVFNLNHPPHIAHWHFIYLSVPNLVVIVVMLVVFALAILLPFPKHNVDRGSL